MLACQEKEPVSPHEPTPPPLEIPFIRGADLSTLPTWEADGIVFFDSSGQEIAPLAHLQALGMNTVRLRLWHSPADEPSGQEAVAAFADRLHAQGLKVWLTVHYSDHWADPGQQRPPAAWAGLGYSVLKDSVGAYTRHLMARIQPDMIQVGNEINPGLLLPTGDRNAGPAQYLGLLTAGIQAVRETSPDCLIMLHYAGIDGSEAFFSQVERLDYDLIGLSFYPWWHGQSLSQLGSTIDQLYQSHQKPVIIAETAYPFTLDWQDNQHNLVGENGQLVTGYPATPAGQADFLAALRQTVEAREGGQGICYWEPSWVTEPAPAALSGWENLCWFDFSHRLLPAAAVFLAE